jgi:hypothetical protein
MVDSTTILPELPAAALALCADGGPYACVRGIGCDRGAHPPSRPGIVLGQRALGAVGAWSMSAGSAGRTWSPVEELYRAGGPEKPMAQAIEAEGLPVVRKLNPRRHLHLRSRCAPAISTCMSSTGTAATAWFHQDVLHDPRQAFEQVRELYARAGVTALEPLGFNNTFAILVRTRDARRLGLRTIDDLRAVAGEWTPGFGYEFIQRADGYPGLSKTYRLSFRSAPRAMDLSLMYRALGWRVDVIAGDATSAQIDALDLTALDDNQHYRPMTRRPSSGRRAAAAPGDRTGHGAAGGTRPSGRCGR